MNIRAIALALLLCLCLTACGGEPEESGGQMSLLETAAGLDGTEKSRPGGISTGWPIPAIKLPRAIRNLR